MRVRKRGREGDVPPCRRAALRHAYGADEVHVRPPRRCAGGARARPSKQERLLLLLLLRVLRVTEQLEAPRDVDCNVAALEAQRLCVKGGEGKEGRNKNLNKLGREPTGPVLGV